MENKLIVKVTIYDDIVGIVNISGELTVFVEEFDLLYKELVAYTKMGIYRFIIDLSNLYYIDSSGIGMIMRLATKASKQSSNICIICDQPQILRILSVSNVDKLVHFVKDIHEGLDYYKIILKKESKQNQKISEN